MLPGRIVPFHFLCTSCSDRKIFVQNIKNSLFDQWMLQLPGYIMGRWHFSRSRPTVEATLLINKHLKWFWSSQKAPLILNVGCLLWLPSAMQVLSHIHRRTFWIPLCPHVPNSTEDRSYRMIVLSTPKSILAGNPLVIPKYNRGNPECEASCGHKPSAGWMGDLSL